MTSILFLIALWGLHADRAASGRFVELDLRAGEVRKHSQTWLLRPRIEHYELQTFGSVVTYNLWEHEGACYTRLELLTRNGGESLGLLQLVARRQDSSFFSFRSKHSEAPICKDLRERIARELSLTDRGFLGDRWTGAQAKPVKVTRY